jgi:hypothetical protein
MRIPEEGTYLFFPSWFRFFSPARLRRCSQSESDNVFQISVIRAVVEGLYDGAMTFAELKEHEVSASGHLRAGW